MTPAADPPATRAGAGKRGTMRAAAPPPQTIVIFGATGDLTRRKLIPALFRLFVEGLLPESFAVLGVAMEPLSDEAYRQRMKEAIGEFAGGADGGTWDEFAARLGYVDADFGKPDGFRRLHERLLELDRTRGTAGNRLFYLAIPPTVIAQVVAGLQGASLVCPDEGCSVRIIVEKPFGRDLRSAQELNALLLGAFEEEQIYRIDHYLGKETVQNLLVFRFGNVVWEPIWNRTMVDHVQITVAETVGVERRAGYYEKAGALRDMVQSHLLQLLAIATMEPPAAYDADSIRDEKVKLLRSIHPIACDGGVVRGQYARSHPGARPMAGYREEPGVAPDSRTETFVALRLCIDNWRWAGVPFFLRTGKNLPTKASEVVVRFRPAPHPILDRVQGDAPTPNALVLRVQPEEGISLFFEAKVPGIRGPLQPVSMDFFYASAFGVDAPEAYERLLLDAMLGDATLFARRDEVEAAWALVDPILRSWEAGGEPEPYAARSWGPPGADAMLAAEGRAWHQP
jgi:glucose-6-phosphate 1-dehydrogenase